MTRATILTGTAIVAAAISMATGAAHAEAVHLRPNLKSGDTHKYATSNTMRTSQQQEGAGYVVSEVTIDTTMSMVVSEVEPDNRSVLDLVYERVALKMVQSFGHHSQEQAFDSDDDPEEDRHPHLAPLREALDKPITIHLSPNGDIDEMRGLDTSLPRGPHGDLLREMMMHGAIGSVLATLFTLGAPDEGVNVGESWSTHFDVPAPPMGVLRVSQTRTLDRVENGKAYVSSVGELKMELPPGAELPPGVRIDINEQKISGTIVWDIRRGALDSMDLGIDARIAAGDNPAIGMELEYHARRAQ